MEDNSQHDNISYFVHAALLRRSPLLSGGRGSRSTGTGMSGILAEPNASGDAGSRPGSGLCRRGSFLPKTGWEAREGSTPLPGPITAERGGPGHRERCAGACRRGSLSSGETRPAIPDGRGFGGVPRLTVTTPSEPGDIARPSLLEAPETRVYPRTPGARNDELGGGGEGRAVPEATPAVHGRPVHGQSSGTARSRRSNRYPRRSGGPPTALHGRVRTRRRERGSEDQAVPATGTLRPG